MPEDAVLHTPGRSLVLWLAFLGAAALLGLLGYLLGFLGFVYNVMAPGAFSGYPAYVLAVMVGVAAFFSPCAFPLLPAYFAYAVGGSERSLLRSLRQGAIAAGGLLVVVLAVGAIIAALGAATPFQPDPRKEEVWIVAVRVAAGGGIALFGLLALLRRTGFAHRLASRFPRRRGEPPALPGGPTARGLFLYGLGYSGAGFGCTGPLLLALTLYAWTLGSPGAALATFGVFAATMALLMVGVTVLVGLARRGAIERLRAAGPRIQTLGGAVTLGVGAWTVYSVTAGSRLFAEVFFPFLGS
ncbi:MAG: hypothetical protein HY558_05695 [Euryarchaeota archaeon]|nr:hypothetical protein [Euryarchaeota archaeon]